MSRHNADARLCLICCAVLCCATCRFVRLTCRSVLKHMPASGAEAQQQWPYALSLAAAEAVNYAKQHLDRCAGFISVVVWLHSAVL